MPSLIDYTAVVAGGTGNVGSFVARSLLERDATVVVPSRSEDKLGGLRDYLRQHVDEAKLDRLHTFIGNVSDASQAADLRRRIVEEVGAPDAVFASLGQLVITPSFLEASQDDLQQALDGYVIAHFTVARTFLPLLEDTGGTYVFVQGPLAFDPWEGSGAHLVSIAGAGQHMLFRALAQELDGSRARVVELVNHAFIRDRETQPSSPLPGETVGAFAAHLISEASDEEIRGESIHLRSPEQLADLGLTTPAI